MTSGTVTLQKRPTSQSSIQWIDWYSPTDPLGYVDWPEFVQLESAIEEALGDPGISSIVIFSPGRHFSPGWKPEAWLNHSTGEILTQLERFQALLLRIEKASKPIVAAIHGKCVGPGMELALACHRVVASIHSSTSFSLEERNLGLIPALGATARLPRLLGLQTALHLLLSGRTYSHREAMELGIAHHAVIPDQLSAAAGTLAESLAGKRKLQRKSQQDWIQRNVEKLWVGRRLILRQTAERIQEASHPSFLAPELILKSTELAWKRGAKEALEYSLHATSRLLSNSGTRSLISLRRLAIERQHAVLTLDDHQFVRRATVLGGGKMGMGLVKLARKFDLDVQLVERNRDRLQVLSQWIQPFQARLFAADTFFPGQAAEFIIEAVDEDERRKKEVLAQAEKYLEPGGFLATNTSTISITELSTALNQPERLVGMHFFMPPGAMPLVEIVPGTHTAPRTLERARMLAGQFGKVWIETKDSPGFFCTRVLGAYLHEALVLLSEGASIQKIDYVSRQFGFNIGPFHFMDMVGLDLVSKVIFGPVARQLERFGDVPVSGLHDMIRLGNLGQKSGKGFYSYRTGEKEVNEEAYESFGGLTRSRISTVRIQHRTALALVNEAIRCLEEGVIAGPEDGDLGAVYGIGFPAFLGGPFRYADELGHGKLVHMLEELMEDVGPRFSPSVLLQEKVELQLPFYRNNSL